jgi:hypothetical protein
LFCVHLGAHVHCLHYCCTQLPKMPSTESSLIHHHHTTQGAFSAPTRSSWLMVPLSSCALQGRSCGCCRVRLQTSTPASCSCPAWKPRPQISSPQQEPHYRITTLSRGHRSTFICPRGPRPSAHCARGGQKAAVNRPPNNWSLAYSPNSSPSSNQIATLAAGGGSLGPDSRIYLLMVAALVFTALLGLSQCWLGR